MPEDTSPTESTMLEQDSPKNAGGDNPDKQGGTLVLPAKATVGEKKVNSIGESVKESIKRRALTNRVGTKRRAPPGTAKRRMADIDEKPQKTEKDSNITEDHCWVKHPPPEGMLLPVVL